MSKILVTGATGFIGRAVCRVLRAAGHTLTGVTRDRSLKRGPENIPLYHITDIGAHTDWSQAVSGADTIVHLAARAHIMRENSADPLAAFRMVNRDGTASLAHAAAAAGVRRLVFLSTAKVNGEASGNKAFDENDTPAPEDAYGISKWEAEKELATISAGTGLETVILRSPLVYGPHVKGNLLSLLKACDKGWPLPLGAINNSRSLVFVDNLASAIAVVASHEQATGKTYLVSDGEDISTPQLVSRLSASLGRRPQIWRVPLWSLALGGALTGKAAAVQRLTGSLVVNSAKIRSELGWRPPFTMEEGLACTADWRREVAPRRTGH